MLQFHAASVSASVAGDYYQLSFGPRKSADERADPHEVVGPYLIVQREFEMPNGDECYVETHDERYIGHFRLRLAEFNRKRLAFEIVGRRDNHVDVSFSVGKADFEKVFRVGEIIFGLREPEPDDDNAL